MTKKFISDIKASDLGLDISKLNFTDIDSEQAQLVHGKSIPPNMVREVLNRAGIIYPTPAKVLSFLMCKGGVGKTSSAFYVGKRLAMYGARVLMIDADPQGNLTGAFNLEQAGIEIDESTPILVDILTGNCSFEEAVIALAPGFHVLPSTPLNSILDGKIRDQFRNPLVPMRTLINSICTKYDFILIDCAPALNLTNTSIVGASTAIWIPVSPDKFSDMGLSQTLRECQQIESDFNFKVEKKIFMTKFDSREMTSKKYLAEFTAKFKSLLAHTRIRVSTEIKNSIVKNEDLFYSTRTTAKIDYDNLAREILGLPNVMSLTPGMPVLEKPIESEV